MTPAQVREARQSLGLTQKQFAVLLHATERTVQMWEAGGRNMQAITEELLKIKLKERKMKLQADNVNGVCKVENFEGAVLSQQDFYDALKDNPNDSIICAEVDEKMAAKIQEEYGIH